jgi:hypothetical protein
MVTDESGIEEGWRECLDSLDYSWRGDWSAGSRHAVNVSISNRTWVSNTAPGSVSVSAPY